MQQVIFTKEGFENLKKEKEELLKGRPSVIEDLQKARALGDLKENGFYHGAKAKLSSLDSRLRRIDSLIMYAKIVESENKDVVSVGTTIVLQSKHGEKKYEVVGEYEANPSLGKISHKSPLGMILLGKKVGETAVLVVPAGETIYTITKIS